jgi:FG-GAP repeat
VRNAIRLSSAATLVLVPLASAQTWEQQPGISASDAAASAQFGSSLVGREGRLLVGAPGGSAGGAAYLFDVATGQQLARFIGSSTTLGDEFGAATDMSGDRIAIGAPSDDPSATNSGAAFIFRYSGGAIVQEARLIAGDPQGLDVFGYSVALDGDWAAFGAPGEDQAGTNAGAVYVFRFNGTSWAQTAKLLPFGANAGDQYGYAVTIRDGRLAVSAPWDDTARPDGGAVYLYRLESDAWVSEAKLTAGDGVSGDLFGRALAIEGNRMLVGVPNYNLPGAFDAGAAFLFERGAAGWSQLQRIHPLDPQQQDSFGVSVALHNGVAAVGAHFEDQRGTNAGALYLFDVSAAPAVQIAKLVDNVAAGTLDRLGFSCALVDDFAFAAAPWDDAPATDCGSVQRFQAINPNAAPTCGLVSTINAECDSGKLTLLLDAAAGDPEGDALTFAWSTDCAAGEFDDPASATPALRLHQVTAGTPPCNVTVSVSDGVNPAVQCTAQIRLVDSRAPELSCPADATIEFSEFAALDPQEPFVSDCDPAVVLSHSDELLDESTCDADAAAFVIRRTWTATDTAGNAASCTTRLTVSRPRLMLDIKPGDCPNKLNPQSNGQFHAAILSTDDYAAAMIDPASVRLVRRDCGGAALAASPKGNPIEWIDAASSISTESCACGLGAADGELDLKVRFEISAAAKALQLNGLAKGTIVELVAIGRFTDPGGPLDGVEFEAGDCVQISGKSVAAAEPLPDLTPLPLQCAGAGGPIPALLAVPFLALTRRRVVRR